MLSFPMRLLTWIPHVCLMFQNEFNNIAFPTSNLQIYHNRYSTSGDFKNHLNNQPIEIGDTSLCFNGVIDMGTKSQMEEKYQIKMSLRLY